MNLVQQQQQEQEQEQDDCGMMPLMSQQLPQHSYGHHMNEEYHQHQLDLSSSCMRQSSSTHQYNDQDQYPSVKEFDAIVQDYLLNLSSKKRDKALIDQARYGMILQVLKDPRNTAVSTAQFRFWVKKMFQLTSRQIVCHDGKPVAMREQIYGTLVRAHREAHHGGRDKTSSLVRRRYSWIPKELIARFVRHCPFCISRRNGSQQSPLSLGIFLPATPPTYSMMPNKNEGEEIRIRAPSMMTSTSSASNASYPEEMMLMAAAAAHHSSQQQQQDTYGSAIDLSSWQQQHQQQSSNQAYYVAGNYYSRNSDYYNSRQQPYSMTYNNHVEEQQHQPMMMQPPLSVYYAAQQEEYGLKQNSNYSLLDSSNFVAPPPPPSRIYAAATTTAVMPSPSLSPSSSSASATSSPVHPAYHDNTDYHLQQQRQQTHQPQHHHGLNLLSHHQSLF